MDTTRLRPFADVQKRFKIDKFCIIQDQLQSAISSMSWWIEATEDQSPRIFCYVGHYYNPDLQKWRVELKEVGASKFIYQDFRKFKLLVEKGLLKPYFK